PLCLSVFFSCLSGARRQTDEKDRAAKESPHSRTDRTDRKRQKDKAAKESPPPRTKRPKTDRPVRPPAPRTSAHEDELLHVEQHVRQVRPRPPVEAAVLL